MEHGAYNAYVTLWVQVHIRVHTLSIRRRDVDEFWLSIVLVGVYVGYLYV
jgi:hypothetical protein